MGFTIQNPPLMLVPSRKLTYPPKNGILKMIFLFPRWDMYPFPGGYQFPMGRFPLTSGGAVVEPAVLLDLELRKLRKLEIFGS